MVQNPRKSNPVAKKKSTDGRKPSAGVGSDTVSVDALLRLKKVVQEIGSIEEANQALEALEKLAN